METVWEVIRWCLEWDVILFVVLAAIHVLAWKGVEEDRDASLEIKQFGASLMSGTSTTGLTAVSILIPASLLVVQLSVGAEANRQLPEAALEDVFRASIWFLVSLVSGLVLMWLVPMRSLKVNVAKNFGVGAFFGLQLFALVLGIVRLIVGLYATIYG